MLQFVSVSQRFQSFSTRTGARLRPVRHSPQAQNLRGCQNPSIIKINNILSQYLVNAENHDEQNIKIKILNKGRNWENAMPRALYLASRITQILIFFLSLLIPSQYSVLLNLLILVYPRTQFLDPFSLVCPHSFSDLTQFYSFKYYHLLTTHNFIQFSAMSYVVLHLTIGIPRIVSPSFFLTTSGNPGW